MQQSEAGTDAKGKQSTLSRGAVETNRRLKKRGWTQGQLARLLKQQSGYVSRVLSGKRNPGLRLATAIERAIGTPASWWLEPAPAADSARKAE